MIFSILFLERSRTGELVNYNFQSSIDNKITQIQTMRFSPANLTSVVNIQKVFRYKKAKHAVLSFQIYKSSYNQNRFNVMSFLFFT